MQKKQITEKLEAVKMIVDESVELTAWQKDETVKFINDAISILNLKDTEE